MGRLVQVYISHLQSQDGFFLFSTHQQDQSDQEGNRQGVCREGTEAECPLAEPTHRGGQPKWFLGRYMSKGLCCDY